MKFGIGETLTRAWQIMWKHRVLWVFGIFASCTNGWSSGGGWDSDRADSGPADLNLPPHLMEVLQNNPTIFLAAVITVFCVIGIVVIFFSVIGRIGLIRSAAQAEDGAEKLIFGQLFSESLSYFWRMLGLFLLIGIPLIVLVAAIVRGIFEYVGSSMPGGDVYAPAVGMILLFCGLGWLIPVGFVVSMVVRQAERAIVLEQRGVIPALSRGWKVFRNNLFAIMLMAITLGVIGFVAGFLFIIPITIIVFPASLAFGVDSAKNTMPLILLGICFCLYLPIFVLLRSILVAYIESAWTLTYLRLTRSTDQSQSVLQEALA